MKLDLLKSTNIIAKGSYKKIKELGRWSSPIPMKWRWSDRAIGQKETPLEPKFIDPHFKNQQPLANKPQKDMLRKWRRYNVQKKLISPIVHWEKSYTKIYYKRNEKYYIL